MVFLVKSLSITLYMFKCFWNKNISGVINNIINNNIYNINNIINKINK